MGDSEDKGTGPQTQPPTVGVERLATLAQEFQALAQGLSVEWAQADETRIALAQVLAERQAQFDESKQRALQLESRLATLEQGQAEIGAERERLQAELAAAVARAEELQGREAAEKEAQAQAASRTSELENRVATLEQELAAERTHTAEAQGQLQTQAAEERTRFEELQSRLDAAEKAAQAAATGPAGEAESRLATLEQELGAERARTAEAQSELQKQTAQATTRIEELQGRLDAAEKAAQAAATGQAGELEARLAGQEQDLTAARARAGEIQAQLEAREKELGERLTALERERDELKSASDPARPEVNELKMQVEGLMRQADGERARWQEERSGIAAERYKALSEAAQLRARVEELEAESARTQPQAKADAEAAEEARAGLRTAEERLAAVGDEVATLKAERSLLLEKVDSVEHARAAAEALRYATEVERDRAKAETSPLWGTIESLQRQIAQERERFESQLARAPEGAARGDVEAVERRLAAETQAATAAATRAEQAEAELVKQRERWDATLGTLKTSLQALHRTPFVSPTLRVAFSGLDEEVAAPGPRKGPRSPRLLFLDRDPLSVEPLANDLEQHGAEVLIAHYSDEVSFFLRTAEAKNLNALVADVMCFRSDQDMVERYKAWRQDAPGATLLVSYRADNPIEAERARNVPGNLGAIHVARTVGREALLEALSKRGTGKGEQPAGLFRRFKR